jgi:hypothetical protein
MDVIPHTKVFDFGNQSKEVAIHLLDFWTEYKFS